MYDLITIGGGPAGYHAAIRAAQLGGKVCVVEKMPDLGGICLNSGCIPTKCIAKNLQVLRKSEALGLTVDDIPNLFRKIMQKKDNVVKSINHGLRALFSAYKIDFVNGHGNLVDPVSIEVNGHVLKTKNMLVATGSTPQIEENLQDGFNKIITHREALELNNIPESIIIMGGGFIGCEFAHIFQSLGSHVSIVEMMGSLLMDEDDEVSARILKCFSKRGVRVCLKQEIEHVDFENDGVRCTLTDGTELVAEKLLVCAGRKANIANLALDAVDVIIENNKIKTDEHMRTNIPTIYAAGDVTASPMLANVAFKEGIVAAENAMGLNSEIKYNVIPNCIFTYPEIASVGINESAARRNLGSELKVGRYPFMANGMALCENEIEGFIKIVTNKNDESILGVSIVGYYASELISEAAMAISLHAKTSDVSEMMHPHPALSETFMEAAADVFDQSIHTYKNIRN